MQSKRFVALIVMFLFILFLPVVADTVSIKPYEPGYSIAEVVDKSVIVVHGRVVAADSVYSVNHLFLFTTDVTIAVENFIKGEANAGANRVKFRAEGGTGTDPDSGKTTTVSPLGYSPFRLNEEVVVFLAKSRLPNPYIPKRYQRTGPYGGLKLFYTVYGKRQVKDGKVNLLYTLADRSEQPVNIPVDVVVLLGKAVGKDRDAVAVLENCIRAQIVSGLNPNKTLSQKLLDSLKRGAQKILDNNIDQARKAPLR